MMSGLTFSVHIATLGYGLLAGIGSGAFHILGIWPAWSYYEAKKSMITGILFGASSIGTAIFGLLFSYVCNPK